MDVSILLQGEGWGEVFTSWTVVGCEGEGQAVVDGYIGVGIECDAITPSIHLYISRGGVLNICCDERINEGP